MANLWESAVILRDKQGAPIPQLWDSSQNKFIPYEGKNKLYGPDGNLISTENPLPVQLSGSKTAYKRQNAGVNYNNYMFVGENIKSYGIAGFIAWNCEFPKKMVIIKNTSAFEIKYGWCLYNRLDIGVNQLDDASLIMRSSGLIPLPSSATGEISFDTLKYPAVGLSIYLLHTAGDASTTGSADVTFLGGA